MKPQQIFSQGLDKWLAIRWLWDYNESNAENMDVINDALNFDLYYLGDCAYCKEYRTFGIKVLRRRCNACPLSCLMIWCRWVAAIRNKDTVAGNQAADDMIQRIIDTCGEL